MQQQAHEYADQKAASIPISQKSQLFWQKGFTNVKNLSRTDYL